MKTNRKICDDIESIHSKAFDVAKKVLKTARPADLVIVEEGINKIHGLLDALCALEMDDALNDKAGVKDIPKEVLNSPMKTLMDNLGVAPRTVQRAVEEIAWEIWQKVKTIQAHEKMHQVFGHNWRSVTQIDDADKTPPCDCGCQVSNPVKKRKWKVVISFDIPIHSAKEPLDEQVAREVRTHLLNNVPDFLENFVDECDWDILPEDDA